MSPRHLFMEKGHIPKIVHSAFKREVGFIHCGNPWTNFTAAKYLLFFPVQLFTSHIQISGLDFLDNKILTGRQMTWMRKTGVHFFSFLHLIHKDLSALNLLLQSVILI